MDRKDFLRNVRKHHPDKGGSNESFQNYMNEIHKNKSDIFRQGDVFAKRQTFYKGASERRVKEFDPEEYSMIFETEENGQKITERVTFKKDNSISRERLS